MLLSTSTSSQQMCGRSSFQILRGPFSRPRCAPYNRVAVAPPVGRLPAPVAASPAGATRSGHQARKPEATSAANDDGMVFTLTAATETAAEAFAAAAAAAEAAQQQLMRDGPIADEMRHNQLLRRAMEAYSTLQRLYHKALLPLMQQHSQLATSIAGLAYALFCEGLDMELETAAADQVSWDELLQLDQQSEKLPFEPFGLKRHKFAQFLMKLVVKNHLGAQNACSCLVLRDALSVIAEGPTLAGPGASTCASEPTAGSCCDHLRPAVEQLLLAAFQPGNQLPALPSIILEQSGVIATNLGACLNGAGPAVNVMKGVLDMLPNGADKSTYVLALSELNTWSAATHSNAFKTVESTEFTIGSLPTWLVLNILAESGFTKTEQCLARGELQYLRVIRNELELGNSPKELLAAVDVMKSTEGVLGLVALVSENTCTEILHHAILTAADSSIKQVEKQRLYHRFLLKYQSTGAEIQQVCYLHMELRGLLEAVDDEGACWPFLFYYTDIRQLALQLTGGKPCSEAVEAAEKLMGEKHSIFVARWALRMCSLHLPSYPGRYQAYSCHSTAPLAWEAELRNLVIARGNQKVTASLAALYPEVPEEIAARAVTCSVGADADSPQPQVGTFLPSQVPQGATIAQHLCKLLTPTRQTSPELSESFEMLMQKMLTYSCAVDSDETAPSAVQHLWFTAGLAGYRILQKASSPETAKLLLGPGQPEEQYIRPIHEYVTLMRARAGLLADSICSAGWDLPSSTGASLATTSYHLLMIAPLTKNKLSSLLWVASAASIPPQARPQKPSSPSAESRIPSKVEAFIPGDVPAMLQAAQGTSLGNFNQYMMLRMAYECAAVGRCGDAFSVLWQILDNTPYSQLQPAAQAALQRASAIAMRRMMPARLPMPTVVQQLVQAVPFLLDTDFLDAARHAAWFGPIEANGVVWKAAVATALDATLCRPPAFGRQRLNEASLAIILTALFREGPEQLAISWGKVQVEVLAAVYQAVAHHIQEQQDLVCAESEVFGKPSTAPLLASNTSTQMTGAAVQPTAAEAIRIGLVGKPPGSIVLECICAVLCQAKIEPNAQLQLNQAVVLPLLQLCQDYPQHAPPQKLLQATLSVLAAAEVPSGSTAVLDVVLNNWQQLQLEPDHVANIVDSAVERAALTGKYTLLQIWSKTLPIRECLGTERVHRGLLPNAATAVLKAMNGAPELQQKLMQEKLPTSVINSLVAAAVQRPITVGQVPVLLQHAQQHLVLNDLDPAVLLQASAAPCCIWLTQDLVAVLLQQGLAPKPQAAAGLLQKVQSSRNGDSVDVQWEMLLQWLEKHCSKGSAAAANTFLCDLLQASTALLDQQQSWQLYELQKRCQQDHNWSAQQLELQPQTFSVLIEHQDDAAASPATNSAARILQLWMDFEESTRLQNGVHAAAKLSVGAQRAVLSAAVAAGRHDDAVMFIDQVPLQLKHLISRWQRGTEQDPISPSTLVAALAVAAKHDVPAADVEQLLQLLWQQQDPTDTAKILLTDLAAQLVQVLSNANQLQIAQRLLSSSLVCNKPAHVAAAFVGRFVSAVAQHAAAEATGLVAAALQLRPELSMKTREQRDLVLETLDQLLQVQDAAATALLLQVAAEAAGSIRGVLQMLSDKQFEQLTALCCSKAATAAPHSTLILAQHVVEMSGISHTALPDAVVATILNAVSKGHPDLQPHRAAQHLGLLFPGGVEPTPDGRSSTTSLVVDVLTAGQPNKVRDVCWVLAALCMQSVQAELIGADTVMDDVGWVRDLTYDAAAAALFACWYLSQHDTISITTSSSGASRRSSLCDHPLPAAAVVGKLCLQLYQHARHSLHSKPSLDSLLLDLGLVAAVDAAAWKEGKDIVSSADHILASSSEVSAPGTKRAQAQTAQLQQHWVPQLPAARPAFVTVLVHTYGVHQAAQLLKQEHERLLEQRTATPLRSKGQRGGVPSSSTAEERILPGPLLLTTPVVNSFLSASLEMLRRLKQATFDDEDSVAAAAAAVNVAEVLFSGHIVTMNIAVTNRQASSELATSAAAASHSGLVAHSLDAVAETWAFLAELYGAAGQYRKLANLVTAAVQQQLPMSRSVGSPGGADDSSRAITVAQADHLQKVLAGAAAAWHTAGAESGWFAMLDGMVAAGAMQLTNPRLAAVLLEAANTDDGEALACRLEGGLDAVYGEELGTLAKLTGQQAAPASAGIAAGGSKRAPAVQLVAFGGLQAEALMLQLQQVMSSLI